MKSVDLTGRRLITPRDVEVAAEAGVTELIVDTGAVLRKPVRLMLQQTGIVLRFGPATRTPSDARPEQRLFHSPEANATKEEICAVGRKLWERSYVDGNGGNISCRIAENAVICTPTLRSKGDITPDDLCLIDLDGTQLAGALRPTSEARLHLEIYRNSAAGAVIHCHPPHATAYAISGRVPPAGIIPEFDVFVGPVVLTSYETPGTRAFAETVLPHVSNHNTILLGNHGVVCWAATPTRAEWQVETLEAYCQTLLLSRQLGGSCTRIPQEKREELLAIKKRLGIPDPRFSPDRH